MHLGPVLCQRQEIEAKLRMIGFSRKAAQPSSALEIALAKFFVHFRIDGPSTPGFQHPDEKDVPALQINKCQPSLRPARGFVRLEQDVGGEEPCSVRSHGTFGADSSGETARQWLSWRGRGRPSPHRH
jgi:hypothetical protein